MTEMVSTLKELTTNSDMYISSISALRTGESQHSVKTNLSILWDQEKIYKYLATTWICNGKCIIIEQTVKEM